MVRVFYGRTSAKPSGSIDPYSQWTAFSAAGTFAVPWWAIHYSHQGRNKDRKSNFADSRYHISYPLSEGAVVIS